MKQEESTGKRKQLPRALLVAAIVLLLAGIAYAAPIAINDDAGPDDFSGQKDLTQLKCRLCRVAKHASSQVELGRHGLDRSQYWRRLQPVRHRWRWFGQLRTMRDGRGHSCDLGSYPAV